MSHHIYLFRMHEGDALNLGEEAIKRFIEVLALHGIEPDEQGCYSHEGNTIYCNRAGKDTTALSIRWNGANAKLIYDLAKSADLTVVNEYGEDKLERPTFIPLSQAQFDACSPLRVEHGYKYIPIAANSDELYTLLVGSAVAAQRYRDQVIGRT